VTVLSLAALGALLVAALTVWWVGTRVANEVAATSDAVRRLRLLRQAADLLRADAASTRAAVCDAADTVAQAGRR
jgi:hypothetical protein